MMTPWVAWTWELHLCPEENSLVPHSAVDEMLPTHLTGGCITTSNGFCSRSFFQWPTFYSSLSSGHKQRGRSVPEHSERWPSQTDKSIAISWQSGHPKKATESSIPARLNPPENEWH
jgi:hypothetical protein